MPKMSARLPALDDELESILILTRDIVPKKDTETKKSFYKNFSSVVDDDALLGSSERLS